MIFSIIVMIAVWIIIICSIIVLWICGDPIKSVKVRKWRRATSAVQIKEVVDTDNIIMFGYWDFVVETIELNWVDGARNVHN